MQILSPWKSVAPFRILSASRVVSYFGSALIRGKDPFAQHWVFPYRDRGSHQTTFHNPIPNRLPF